MRARRLLGVLGEREFRRLYLARAFSQLGDGLLPVALAFAVLDVDASPSALGFVLAARTVPLVAFVLVGGVWADRLERQRVMLASDLLRAATQGLLAVLVLTDRAELWHFLVLAFLYGCGSAFFLPASTGLVPQLVTSDRLQQANALLSLTGSVFSVIGPALAGIIIALSAPGWAIAIDGVTFLISAAFLTRIRLPAAAARVVAGFLTDLRDGWREFRSRTWLWVDGVYAALANALVLSPLLALGPVVADRELDGASSWATIATAFGLGSVAGGVFAIRLRPRRPLRVAVASLLTIALPPALLAIPAGTAAIAVGSFAAGLGLIFFNTIFETTLQQHVPRESLSRVVSIDWMLSVGLQPIGFALAGPAAEAFGLSAALAYAAVWGVVSTAIVLAVPSVRNLPRHEGLDVNSA
jgi:Transmembrane secretion effector